MTIGDITYTPGSPATVSATIDAPAGYTSDDHFVSVLLIGDDGLPVPIDYYSSTKIETDESKRITGVTVSVDAPLPPNFRAVVMTDAFPAKTQDIGGGS
jgi:hypothetical protein